MALVMVPKRGLFFSTNACVRLGVGAGEAYFPRGLCAVIWFWGYELSYGAVMKASWFLIRAASHSKGQTCFSN